MSKPVFNKNGRSSGSCRSEEAGKISIVKRFLRKLRNKLPRKRRYKGQGRVYATKSSGWTEKELKELIHDICKKSPGITSINFYKGEVNWTFECSREELRRKPKKQKELANPSKREQTKI